MNKTKPLENIVIDPESGEITVNAEALIEEADSSMSTICPFLIPREGTSETPNMSIPSSCNCPMIVATFEDPISIPTTIFESAICFMVV